jgi:DNA-binding PadR family transcriptional regulator
MPKAKGPLPRFSEVHMQLTLDLISKHRRIGRQQLANKLGIGEGSVRTILDHLKERGLITSSRGGHALTEKGKSFLREPREFVPVDAGDLTVGKANVATVVRGAADRVKRGIEQRDEAIKVGANGATVLVFKGGRLRLPGGFAKIKKEVSETLIKALAPQEGDVVIIGAGKDLLTAEAGARAAARTLSRQA